MRALFATLLLLLAACGDDDVGNRDPLVVATSLGEVRGVSIEGLRVFRGIPYAAPPVGELRFRPPQPHPGWSDVRPADSFGPGCLQVVSPLRGPEQIDEDCLSLNVWAHDDDQFRPVLVFVHGGGFVGGHASNPRSDAAIFARETGTVVVAMNYRVGALGYLASPALREEDGAVGNYGLRDQVFALQWVRDNIATFGGDPDRVTLMGESAGAFSVCLLLAVEAARGLMDGAILHSGGCSGHAYPDEPGLFGAAAYDTAAEVTEVVGCGGATDVAACLRDVDGQLFVDALARLEPNPFGLAPTAPVIDGVLVTEQPIATLARGTDAGVPVLIGSTADDYSLFTIPFRNDDPERIEARFGLVVDPVPAEVRETYSREEYGSSLEGLSTFMTDYVFACPTLRLGSVLSANDVPAYVFHFTATVGGPLSSFGSFHGLDWGLAFGNDDELVEVSAEHLEIAASMRHAWGSFIRNGVPANDDGSPWPIYDPGDPAIQIVDRPSRTTAKLREGRCELLDRLGVVP